MLSRCRCYNRSKILNMENLQDHLAVIRALHADDVLEQLEIREVFPVKVAKAGQPLLQD